MQIKDKTFEVYITHQQILQRITSLSDEISRDYMGKDPLVIGVLNGSFYFFAELTLQMNQEVEVAFVRYQSYEGTQSTGDFVVSLPFDEKVGGRDIILVEDIVDTGSTLVKLHEELKKFSPKSVEIVSLLLKPTIYRNQFPVKYVGFEIPAEFVLGFGLDYDGRGRNLRDIYVLSR